MLFYALRYLNYILKHALNESTIIVKPKGGSTGIDMWEPETRFF